MKVALDAMGGDFAPKIPVEGALAALDEAGDELSIVLVGPEDVLRRELADRGRDTDKRLEIADAKEVISMHEKAGRAVRQKPNSSLLRSIELHKAGEAQAVVSAGHTGAQMAASYLILGLIEGVRRPTIATLIPTGGGRVSVLLDVGANTDCKPVNLLQFAVMGAVLIEVLRGVKNPRVALLSIGREKTKGNEQVAAAHYLLEQSGLNFTGNVEGSDLFSGMADVIVCDGFVGNIVLKVAESLGPLLFGRLRELNCKEPAYLQGLQEIQKEYDSSETGGVPLLGINGISIICHGNSSAKAIKNAIREAVTLSKGDLPSKLSRGVGAYEVGMIARGMARLKSFQERRDHERERDKDD